MPFQNKEGKIFLNLSEIAERWGVTLGSVLKLHVNPGRLKTIRAGKAHLVSVEDLKTYEESLVQAIQMRIAVDYQKLERLKKPILALNKPPN